MQNNMSSNLSQQLSRKIIFIFSIAFVWLSNGLFCKVLNLVPRHQQIVARILGEEHSALLTKTIGVLEIIMAIWIVSNIKSRWCAYTQILVVMTMNIIETILVPDLLLFGYLNIVFAFLFSIVVYWNEFSNTLKKMK